MKDFDSIYEEFMSDMRNAMYYGVVIIAIFALLSLCVYQISSMFSFAIIIIGIIAYMASQTYFLVIRTNNLVKSTS